MFFPSRESGKSLRSFSFCSTRQKIYGAATSCAVLWLHPHNERCCVRDFALFLMNKSDLWTDDGWWKRKGWRASMHEISESRRADRLEATQRRCREKSRNQSASLPKSVFSRVPARNDGIEGFNVTIVSIPTRLLHDRSDTIASAGSRDNPSLNGNFSLSNVSCRFLSIALRSRYDDFTFPVWQFHFSVESLTKRGESRVKITPKIDLPSLITQYSIWRHSVRVQKSKVLTRVSASDSSFYWATLWY